MSMFCTNCGCALDENTTFCTNCGAALDAAAPAPQMPVQPAPVRPEPEVAAKPVYEAPAAPAAPKKPLDLKKLAIPAVAAVAVIAVVILLFSLLGGGGKGYTSAIDAYFDYLLGEASKSEIKSMLPDAFWDYKEAQEGKTFDDYYAEVESYLENRAAQVESEYGKNIKVTYEITKEWNVSDRNQELIAAALLRQFNIEEDELTDARKLEMEATIAGTEDEESDNMTFYVIKIDGDWYLARVYLNAEKTIVRFVAS